MVHGYYKAVVHFQGGYFRCVARSKSRKEIREIAVKWMFKPNVLSVMISHGFI